MRDDPSPDKPAWRILYTTVTAPVREFVARPQVRIVENGPVRVAVEISRTAAGSTIVQRVSLTQGGDRVDVENEIDWKSPNTLLKAAFPLAASNPKATYDLGLGTIQRPNNTADAYEVPAQQWADVTDVSGGSRRRGAQRQQVRLGQAGRQRAAVDAAAHGAAARDAVSGQQRSRPSPVHVRDRRTSRRLAGRARARARGAIESADRRVSGDAASRRARARDLDAVARRHHRPDRGRRDEEGRGLRRDRGAVPGEVRPRRPHARDDAGPDRVGARNQRGRRGRRPARRRTATP